MESPMRNGLPIVIILCLIIRTARCEQSPVDVNGFARLNWPAPPCWQGEPTLQSEQSFRRTTLASPRNDSIFRLTSNDTFRMQPIWRFNRKRSCTSINPGAYLLPEINLEMQQKMFPSPSEDFVEDPVDDPIETRIETDDTSDDVVVGMSQGQKKENDKIDDGDDDNDDDKPPEGYSSMGWVLGGGNQLGMFELVDRDLRVYNYAAINGSRFRVAPGYAMRFLSGPDTTDLPPYLFSIFADVGMGVQIGQNWVLDGIISPSWNTDFANKGFKLFRLPWQVVNTLQVSDELKIVLGVTDLARQDIRVLPVVGFSYVPSDGSKQFDLIFPRPRMAWRLSHRDNDSHWGYIAGELGGGSFSILREDRQDDIVTLRDYRLLAGWECRSKNRHASRLEAGWVFGRAVEYQSNRGNYHPDDTMIIRLSNDY